MKYLFVTTISSTVNAFLVPHIEMLVQQGHQVDVAFNKVKDVDDRLKGLGCNIHQIDFERSPLSKSNIQAFKQLQKVLKQFQYDVVHTHTPIASACVRVACRNTNIKVIYTAHGFHFHKGAPLKNWLMYYPLEKILSKYTDVLITINEEDYHYAKEKFFSQKTLYVPGVGLDLAKFQSDESIRIQKRQELQVKDDTVVLLSIGELNANKNHKVVIHALSKLENKNIKYFICGVGPLQKELQSLIGELNMGNQVELLGFTKDIAEICNAADIFVFPSYREGLPVSVMEAMACGLPVIASNIRGNQDLIVSGKGGYLVNPDKVEDFEVYINTMIDNVVLRKQFAEYNREKIKSFSLNEVLQQMSLIYND